MKKKPLILVVDDTDASRYIAARVLRAAQMDVVEAATGEAALRLAEERKPDLVLLDIKLPDVNGLEVCRRIRANPAIQRVAVLHVSSTYVTPEIELESQESGGDIYLSQPVEPRELVSVVKALIRMRELERDLMQSEERLRLAAEAAEIATWEINLETGEAVFDQQMQRLLGFGPVERAATWAAWRDRIHQADAGAVTEAFDAAKSRQGVFRKEHRLVLPGGEVRWVTVSGRVHVEEGQPARLIGVLADVSDRKHVEEEREGVMRLGQAALDEASKVVRLKDEFLATLSHELRTPISVLTNWLSVMRAAPPGPQELADGLDIMQRNARLMTKLINDLLDVSSIMSGKLQLEREPAAVDALLAQAIDNVRPAAEAKEITLSAECEKLAGPALIDPNRLQQVFLNLLSNAIKFTGPGGRIEAHCRQVGTQLEITVSDDGEGIAPEMLSVIFDRFRQVDSSITRRHGGLGLGLAIVRHLVELHGGEVSAWSAGRGKGATFTVKLPFQPAAVQRGPGGRFLSGPAQPGNRLRNIRILAVDDDADARDALERLLMRERAVVRTAGSAREALSIVEAWRPDVFLLDLGMPGESGYDLLAQLRSRLGEGVLAIALTGYAREEDAARTLYAGFQAHLAKPYKLDELCRNIISVAHPVES